MADKVNLGPGFRAQARKQTAQERHVDEVHAASVIDDLAVPEDAGELFAAMDASGYDPDQDRARHESELANSEIPALKSLRQALKTMRTQEKSQGQGQGMEAPGMSMSKSWDITP